MAKNWHGRNKGNRQSKNARLFSKTLSTYDSLPTVPVKEPKISPPILFYCKKCKFESILKNIFDGHTC